MWVGLAFVQKTASVSMLLLSERAVAGQVLLGARGAPAQKGTAGI